MKLEYESLDKLKKDILDIVGRHLDLKEYKVFFFGSRVAGTNFPRADIDLGVEGPKPIPAKIKLEIEEKLENLRTLFKIDFVDFQNVSEKFKKEAKKFLELLK